MANKRNSEHEQLRDVLANDFVTISRTDRKIARDALDVADAHCDATDPATVQRKKLESMTDFEFDRWKTENMK